MQRPTANELVSLLDLHPLEREGGMYRETYRCKTSVNGRSCGSAIYFLMTQNAFPTCTEWKPTKSIISIWATRWSCLR